MGTLVSFSSNTDLTNWLARAYFTSNYCNTTYIRSQRVVVGVGLNNILFISVHIYTSHNVIWYRI